MRKVLLVFSVVVLFAYSSVSGMAADSIAGGPSASARKGGAASVPEHVRELYAQDCAECHGATGNGKTDLARDMNFALLDWTNPKSLAGFSDQQLFEVIRDGKGKMPAEDPARANNQAVWGMIRYIRSMSKPPAPGPSTKKGAPGGSPVGRWNAGNSPASRGIG